MRFVSSSPSGPPPRVFVAVVLGAVGVLTAVAVVVAVGLRGGAPRAVPIVGRQQIATNTALEPRAVLFGDTVTARIDVTFDRTQYDPADVHVVASFVPWAPVGRPTVEREDSGPTTFLRTTYVLRCLSLNCVPNRGSTLYQFRPARVVYRKLGVAKPQAVAAHWPGLVLHSRLDPSGPAARDTLAAPWRVDPVTLPAVAYRFSPGWLEAILLVAGAVLVVLAAVLAYRVRPRRLPPPPPPPAPPPPRLAPIEQALALLEAPAANGGGSEERRRALELVADEIAGWGEDAGLERDARRLAWSEHDPVPAETRSLAARVRAHAEEADGRSE